MMEAHFGLQQRPFRPTPDSDCYYPATTHERALDRLLKGIAADDGLLLLTGEPGTGKTLLCHRLLERLGPDAVSAFLTNSRIDDRAGLLQAILFELSLPYASRSVQEMRLALTDFLLENYKAGRRAIVLVDEAHHLSADLLEELRLLGNLASAKGRAVQVVLIAQPTILETLQRSDLTAVRQRLAVRVRVEPLGVQEAADYLIHQLRAVGGRPDRIITDEALEVLARGTGGIARLLNQAASQALSLACETETSPVDAEVALEALGILGLETVEAPEALATGEAAESEAVLGFEEEETRTSPNLFTPVRRPA